MRKISWIVIHCSAGFGDVASIKKYWKSLGWKQVGYHYFIYEDGTIIPLASISGVTNGVKGYNKESIHICYQGGVEKGNVSKAKDTRTHEQKESLLKTINMVLTDLKQYQDISDIKILGHRDFSPDKNGNGVIEPYEFLKQCPSFDAYEEYFWITGNSALKSGKPIFK